MTTQHHALEIYEPYDYHGANPLMVSGVMVLAGPMRDKYYLVEPDQPLIIEQLQLSQLLVQPRYNGDKIDRAVSSTCTVNISLSMISNAGGSAKSARPPAVSSSATGESAH